MNLKVYCIILIALLGTNRCIASDGLYVVSKESNETLIGVKLKSLNNSKIEGTSDLNGFIKLEGLNKVNDETLELQYTGYKSVVISRDELLKLYFIQLEELQTDQTLGTTGILPIRLTKFYINSNSIKNINSEEVEREIAIERLQGMLNSFYKKQYGQLVVSFEVDKNGNILSFELLEFSFQPINQLEQLKLQFQDEVINRNLRLGKDNFTKTAKGKLDTIKYSLPVKVN